MCALGVQRRRREQESRSLILRPWTLERVKSSMEFSVQLRDWQKHRDRHRA